ncbi:hypothetical protein [Nodularia sp. NIES-3585]|uniref:hypothetical protein n=1 Tax=Nodularia sp. NIES-3585 TaxID=1973477 RepID=UPI000B5CF2B1|nr:hypothetical protein [Nodularia sp. NIES-3585]GAX38830.1 hypothetical protein NIES3585_48820 [Nodularia sp. NIES-3585]
MDKPQHKDVYLQRIKRKTNSWDGLVIDYLSNHPSGKAAAELSMEAVVAYWLAEALEGKVSQDELTKACRSAIEKLSGKLATIRMIGGIDRLPTSYLSPNVVPSTTTTNDDSQLTNQTDNDDDDDDDDWGLMKMHKTEEMEQINKIFGV